MKSKLVIALGLLCLSFAAIASDNETTAEAIFQEAINECKSLDEGEFDSTERTTTLHDLTGDGRPEEIVDASQFSCSSAASLWGGSGGTFLWVIVEGKAYEFLAHRWKVVDMDGQNVLLMAVHSSECGDTIGPCYRAVVWGDEGFRTIR
ncbi:MAG: hypothetical protein V2I57_05445 [Xanthomonadales bacterium]|nr:hypothetical protein [Xanthomonadales bacterium]